MKIYLAGKIPKGKDLENYIDWRKDYESILSKHFHNLEILNPDNDGDNLATEEDYKFWYGSDASMIKEADAIIIKADSKLGVGTSQEMLIAKYFNKPVITILPKNTHHRKNNIMMRSGFVEDWIHPFINASSDVIFENIEESISFLKDIKNYKIKNITLIDEYIEYYQNKKLDNK